MAPFQFALSPVLQLRERAVEAAQEELGQTVRARAEAEAAVETAAAAFAEHVAAGAKGRTVRQLGHAATHRDSLARQLEAARRVADRLRADETRARRALADTLREREALTVLRTEAADAHRANAHRIEVAALDELASAGRAARALSVHS